MRIVYLCHFSNQIVREHLSLKKWKMRNSVFRLLKHSIQTHADYAVWNTDFISEFEKYPDLEFHIVSPHNGMKKSIQSFNVKGINYHFFKDDGNLLYDYMSAKLNSKEKTNYRSNRQKIKKIIDSIQPDLVVLCGSECTPFAIGVLDVVNTPIYVFLQSCANLKKYIDAGIGSDYNRSIERAIFRKAKYFGTRVAEFYEKYKEINNDALCLSIAFPTHQPVIHNIRKEYDFVFFGRVVKNKGIEDVIKALALVSKKYPETKLNIIGQCSPDYRAILENMIHDYSLGSNVVFSPYYEKMDDMYRQVQKSHYAVLPGITAPLNSTVRESMFMRMPTIVYNNNAIEKINTGMQCLFAARMKDHEDLALKMSFCMGNPNEAMKIADNAFIYAQENLSNKQIGEKIVENIKAIINYTQKGTPIPEDLLFQEIKSV